jgi:hypothetical protein
MMDWCSGWLCCIPRPGVTFPVTFYISTRGTEISTHRLLRGVVTFWECAWVTLSVRWMVVGLEVSPVQM